MNFECIKTFTVDDIDENGFTIDGSEILIVKGSIWEIDEDDFRMVGAEIRLLSNEYGWLEITKERLKSHFKSV